MQQTKIWATEEIIIPTLIRLLGYEIAKNPCSYDYVQYQKTYTPEDINVAIKKPKAFWLHPVPRQYDDPLRKYTRERLGHYFTENKRIAHPESKPNMMLTLPLLQRIKEIEGWLDDQEADLLISTTLKVCIDLPAPHAIVEIGSYHGKSTIVLGKVLKSFFPGSKVYAFDSHDDQLKSINQRLHSFSPYHTLKRNIEIEGLTDIVEIKNNNFGHAEWKTPVSLLFIDGLHDYPNVARDFYHFAEWIRPGGYVAFHDFADYFPDVQAFVSELLGTGTYREIYRVLSLIVVQKEQLLKEKQI